MAPAEITSAVTSVSEILAPLGGLSLMLLSLWIIYRTKSAYLIRRRMLRFLTGDFQADEDVRKFLEEQDALMMFRASTRIQADTIRQAKLVSTWITESALQFSYSPHECSFLA